jgi:hypothetical protein
MPGVGLDRSMVPARSFHSKLQLAGAGPLVFLLCIYRLHTEEPWGVYGAWRRLGRQGFVSLWLLALQLHKSAPQTRPSVGKHCLINDNLLVCGTHSICK